jgi:uncharacterized membrane protein YhaH (DUF805 family)
MEFYNNIAAVASVLLFAKLVTHRNRSGRAQRTENWWWALLHSIAVLAAACAIVLALLVTGYTSADLRHFALGLLLLSGAILIFDVLFEDWSTVKCAHRNK